MRNNYKMYPTDYILELQQKGKREKARCFLEYFNDVQFDQVNSISFYAFSWGSKVDGEFKAKSKGSVHKWIKEFSYEIERFFTYWNLKNKQHYNSVSNKSERKVNGHNIESERKELDTPTIDKGIVKTKVNGHNIESERKVNKEFNLLNSNNINAESKDSAIKKTSNKKNIYSNSFEILWQLYDKKSSNKNRSFSIYKKRWLKTDIKLIKMAIKKYRENINPMYYKDFDGFLNGVIDSYIPLRAWVKDANQITHYGFFHDIDGKFISDNGNEIIVPSQNIAHYIENGNFGYLE